jgi:hypothetical protein
MCVFERSRFYVLFKISRVHSCVILEVLVNVCHALILIL